MGDFGCNMSFTLISSYMFIFYTQYIGISLAHYSIIILITKIFDGINDPIIGAIVDRMGADKKGEKFKQWILRGSPFLALAATVIFIDAADWSYAAKLGLCIGGYILWDLTYTVVNVPYGALSSVMTSKPSQRAALSNARSWGYIIAGVPLGILIPLFTYEQVTKNGQTASIFRGERMFPIAIILSIISIVAFALLYLNTEERIQHTESEGEKVKFNYFITLKDFFRNRAILGISLASIAQILFIMGGNQLQQLTYQMYFRDGTLSSYAILTQIIPLFVGTALGGSLVGKLGKKNCRLGHYWEPSLFMLFFIWSKSKIRFFGSRCRSSQTASPSVWRSTLGGWLRMQSTTKNGRPASEMKVLCTQLTLCCVRSHRASASRSFLQPLLS